MWNQASTSNWLPLPKVLGLRSVDACPSETPCDDAILFSSVSPRQQNHDHS